MDQQPLPKRSAAAGLQIILPLLIIAGYGLLAAISDLRLAVPEMLAITAAITVCITVAGYLNETGVLHLSARIIFAIAIVVRLFFLFHAPQLSDDIYRYLFDGGQLLSGRNPYAAAPADVLHENSDAAALAAKVNHPNLKTIYPPGAQLLFVIGAFLGGITGFKLMLITMDIALIVLMMRIASVTKAPKQWVILYAWHPLVVIEIAGSGHIDAAGIFFLFLALTLALGYRDNPVRPATLILSGGCFAWACLVKLFPVVAAPLFFFSLRGKQQWLFLAGCLLGGLVLCLPFLPHLPHMLDTLATYTRHWEFSGLSYFQLRHWGISGDLSRIILGSAFVLALSVIVLRSTRTSGDLTKNVFHPFYLINLFFLFLTPTLHPWYALYLVSMLPFVPGVTGLVLSWSVFLAYSVQIPYVLTGQWIEHPLSTYLIWIGPLLTLMADKVMEDYR